MLANGSAWRGGLNHPVYPVAGPLAVVSPSPHKQRHTEMHMGFAASSSRLQPSHKLSLGALVILVARLGSQCPRDQLAELCHVAAQHPAPSLPPPHWLLQLVLTCSHNAIHTHTPHTFSLFHLGLRCSPSPGPGSLTGPCLTLLVTGHGQPLLRKA